MKNLIVVLSGPSGAGKGSLYKEISKRRNVSKYVSATTRKPREGEINGVDYDFITVEEFKKKMQDDYFLETIKYADNYYGTPKPNLETQNGDIFFDLNAEGSMKIKKLYPEAVLIYILPPNVKELVRRIGNRGKERIKLAEQEKEIAKKFDWLIINENLEDATNQIEAILTVERQCRMMNCENQNFLDTYYLQ